MWGWVFIKLYLQKQVVGRIWQTSYSLLAPALPHWPSWQCKVGVFTVSILQITTLSLRRINSLHEVPKQEVVDSGFQLKNYLHCHVWVNPFIPEEFIILDAHVPDTVLHYLTTVRWSQDTNQGTRSHFTIRKAAWSSYCFPQLESELLRGCGRIPMVHL